MTDIVYNVLFNTVSIFALTFMIFYGICNLLKIAKKTLHNNLKQPKTQKRTVQLGEGRIRQNKNTQNHINVL